MCTPFPTKTIQKCNEVLITTRDFTELKITFKNINPAKSILIASYINTHLCLECLSKQETTFNLSMRHLAVLTLNCGLWLQLSVCDHSSIAWQHYRLLSCLGNPQQRVSLHSNLQGNNPQQRVSLHSNLQGNTPTHGENQSQEGTS